MPRPTMREQIEELERTLEFEQKVIPSLRAEIETQRKQIEAMHQHSYLQNKQIEWFKRVIECLVSPDDNKRVF